MNKIAYFLDTGFVWTTKQENSPHDVESFFCVVWVCRKGWTEGGDDDDRDEENSSIEGTTCWTNEEAGKASLEEVSGRQLSKKGIVQGIDRLADQSKDSSHKVAWMSLIVSDHSAVSFAGHGKKASDDYDDAVSSLW